MSSNEGDKMNKAPTVITVANTEKDKYGNLLVIDTLGNVTRINQKHENLHPLFVLGRTVKLIWDNYKGKDFVSDAELFDGKPPAEKQVEPITAGVGVPPLQTIPGQEHGLSRNRSFALSYAKDLAVADKIPSDKILSYAEVFLRWLDGNIQVADEEIFKVLLKKTFLVV